MEQGQQLCANKIELQGFIASELSVEPTKNGGKRCYFDIKVVSDRKKVEYIPITLWNAAAEQFVQKFHKGDNIRIEGELTRNSSPDGRKYLVINCGVIRLIVAAQSSSAPASSKEGTDTNIAQKSSFTKKYGRFCLLFGGIYAILDL